MHVGETFKNEIFKSVCREWGNEVIGEVYFLSIRLRLATFFLIGCLVQDRELGELELIVGQQIEAGCYTHSCTKESEIPWKIRYEARPKPGCVQPVSKEYSINQTSRLAIKRTVYPLHELADSFFKADKSFSAKYRYLS